MNDIELREFHLEIGRLQHKIGQIKGFNNFKQAGDDILSEELASEVKIIGEDDILAFLHLLNDIRIECNKLESQLLKKEEEPMEET